MGKKNLAAIDHPAVDFQSPARILEKEIAQLRSVMNRAFDLALGIQDPLELARVMSALSLTATRVAQLLKVEQLMEGPAEEWVEKAIDQVIEDLVAELGLEI